MKWDLKENGIGLYWEWRTFQYENQQEWGHGVRKLWVISEVTARRLDSYSLVSCKREIKIEAYTETRAWETLELWLKILHQIRGQCYGASEIEWPFRNQLKETSLVAQWLRLRAPNAGGIPGRVASSHMLCSMAKRLKKKKSLRLWPYFFLLLLLLEYCCNSCSLK